MLGNENYIVKVVTVLAEEADPLHAVSVQALAAVEWDLCLVYDDNALMFAVSRLKMFLGVTHEKVRGHIQSVNHYVFAPVFFGVSVDLEVCDHGDIAPKRAVDNFGGVVAFTAAGSACV